MKHLKVLMSCLLSTLNTADLVSFPLPLLSGIQTSQPVHGRGAGNDGESLRCPLLLPDAASQSGAIPPRRRASAYESYAQVR